VPVALRCAFITHVGSVPVRKLDRSGFLYVASES
jgi:hypothetical protein